MKLLPHSESLQRAKDVGVEPATLIDVGAAEGDWSEMAFGVWRSMRVHIIEAAPHCEDTLEKRRAADDRLTYTLTAASDVADDDATFWINPNSAYGGQLMAAGTDADRPSRETVPTTTIDDNVAALDLPGPYMIKLDTHGFEQAILAGARKALEHPEPLVFETYNFGVESRRFGQMAVHVEEELGFRVFDLGEPMWRPIDNALWQLDFFCLPATHETFSDVRYQ